MIENEREQIIRNHQTLIKTYNDLKDMFPFGYMKTRISPGYKYNINKIPILIDLEKEKSKDVGPTKLTQNLLYNKNIYLFSEQNKDNMKLLSKLKKPQKINKPQKKLIIYDNEGEINLYLNSQQNNLFNDNNNNNNFYQGKGNFRSSSIRDCMMKNNIYLPHIIDRMKNNIPRYKRKNKGFLVEGIHQNKC